METFTRESLAECILGILRDEILRVESAFTAHSDLVEAGLDSLAVTQLMLSIEERTGLWVDEALLTPETLATAATLAALVHEQLPGS